MIKNQNIKSFCNDCKKETNHKITKSYHTENKEYVWLDEDNMRIYIDWYDDYQIIQCLWCNLISFKHISYFSERDDMPEEIHYPQKEEITTIKIKLPSLIQNIYQETIIAYNKNLRLLCAIWIRATIESICKDKKINGWKVNLKFENSLKGKIQWLIDKWILTQENWKILHKHRLIGNKAAHKLEKWTQEELLILIEIIQIILQTIYEIKDKNDELEKINYKKKEA